MLSKDLLRTRVAGNYIKPLFVETDNAAALELAKKLLGIFTSGIGKTREYIEGFTNPGAASFRDVKLGRGILKVIADKADFSASDTEGCRALRRRVFLKSAELLKAGTLPDEPGAFRKLVSADSELYADLPEKECLKEIKSMSPREVLERYNMSLVQSLLLYTSKLELDLPADGNPQLLRSVCRYLRFFRLLASAEMKDGRILLNVDGPASIFENGTKYGLQTASFFPIVCRIEDWKAACTVKLKDRPLRLLLDQKSGLVCHFTNYSSYQPEEIRLFADYFRSKESAWEIDDAPGFLRAGQAKLLFPDFAFHSKTSGRTFHLELFHRWHLSQLGERLEECEAGKLPDLLLGVDRALLKQDGILKTRLEQSGFFQKSGFLFRDFPGVKNVVELLDGSLI